MATCPSCSAELETPLGCASCGALFEVAEGLDPFALFGLEPCYAVDPELLRRRLLRASRIAHPDFHAGRPEEALAERNTAALNAAYRLLQDDARRADWLVTELGGPAESDERAMPEAFLLEVMEWNETLEEARAGPGADPQALDSLEAELRARRAATMQAVAAALDPLPERGAAALAEVRRQLNAVRYLDRALEQLAELKLDRATSS